MGGAYPRQGQRPGQRTFAFGQDLREIFCIRISEKHQNEGVCHEQPMRISAFPLTLAAISALSISSGSYRAEANNIYTHGLTLNFVESKKNLLDKARHQKDRAQTKLNCINAARNIHQLENCYLPKELLRRAH